MRCPVAAEIALSTAGAATKIVGSPTPPQNPPDGMMMHSTLGMREPAAPRIFSGHRCDEFGIDKDAINTGA
jgi:hypothetical protein